MNLKGLWDQASPLPATLGSPVSIVYELTVWQSPQVTQMKRGLGVCVSVVSVQCPCSRIRKWNALKPPLLQVMEMEVTMEGTRTTMEETRAMEAIKITEEVDLEVIRPMEVIKTTEEVVVDMGATKTMEAVKTTEEVEVDLEVDTGNWYGFLRKIGIN